jgi:hypothetical protein
MCPYRTSVKIVLLSWDEAQVYVYMTRQSLPLGMESLKDSLIDLILEIYSYNIDYWLPAMIDNDS